MRREIEFRLNGEIRSRCDVHRQLSETSLINGILESGTKLKNIMALRLIIITRQFGCSIVYV